MLRCIIVDDESGAIEILSRYIEKTPELKLFRSFRDPIEALAFLADNDVELIFMDIDMPNLNGMQLSELVRNKDIQVIFCTAYSEYAVESYEKDAVDYLLKPISYERFLKAARKALTARFKSVGHDLSGITEKRGKAGKLFIKSGPRIHRIDTAEVLSMEKKGHYVVFHLPGKELLSRMNMNDLMDILPPDRFVRVHRSFVIAIDKIDTIEKNAVIIRGKKIPIGESFRDGFFRHIQHAGN
jgi:two-component system LytT family response regulator